MPEPGVAAQLHSRQKVDAKGLAAQHPLRVPHSFAFFANEWVARPAPARTTVEYLRTPPCSKQSHAVPKSAV